MDVGQVYQKLVESMDHVADELTERGNKGLIRTLGYYNGDDGTGFDWAMNGRTCEFGYDYEGSSLYAVKAWVGSNGVITVYGYDFDAMAPAIEKKINLESITKAEGFAALLDEELDSKAVFDGQFRLDSFVVPDDVVAAFHSAMTEEWDDEEE